MAITRIGNPALANVREPNFRNLIINGDMSLAQRGTSFSSISSGNGTYPVDRFRNNMSGAGTWTISQSTTVPTGQGFATSVKYDCTTADGSLAAGDFLIFQQIVEAQNLQYLKFGTSSAQSLTLSFWVRSNKTGTYIAEFYIADTGRSFSKSYTIDSADTWEKKTITFPGDTGGAINNDNGTGLELNFWLAAGSTYSSGSLQTSWGTRVNANMAAGQVNLADSTSNEWYVTGIQLEAGSVASDFEFLPVDVNEQRCQRYYFKTTESGTATILLTGGLESSTSAGQGGFSLPTKMRATPSLSFGSGIKLYSAGSGASTASISQNRCTTTVLSCAATVSGGTVGQAGYIYRATSDGFLVGDAEL
jgi:hypothetical protein